MKTKLPQFEGEAPTQALLKLTGGSDDRVGALQMGEDVFVIVRGTVSAVTHGDVKDVFTRIHKVQAQRIVLLDGSDGERMLDEASALADERFGLENLFAQAKDAVDPDTGEMTE